MSPSASATLSTRAFSNAVASFSPAGSAFASCTNQIWSTSQDSPGYKWGGRFHAWSDGFFVSSFVEGTDYDSRSALPAVLTFTAHQVRSTPKKPPRTSTLNEQPPTIKDDDPIPLCLPDDMNTLWDTDADTASHIDLMSDPANLKTLQMPPQKLSFIRNRNRMLIEDKECELFLYHVKTDEV